jgi:hypothetical protein
MKSELEDISFHDEKEFEERSDNIKDDDLSIWNIENDHFLNIQKKLIGAGAKLIGGPRGTGKTHQIRIVYQQCIMNVKTNNKPVAIFSSFGKYFFLEPLLSKAPNAIQIFHTWVLCKIADGYFKYIKDSQLDTNEFINAEEIITEQNVIDFIDKAEKLNSSSLLQHQLITEISISKVINLLEALAIKLNKPRVVLLLDDAALTFTPDYLVEFFDIFRSFKTKIIAPKASVYPGTTQYGPRFHIGQDAELVNCWMSVMDSNYIAFMESLIEKRFSSYTIGVSKDILDIFEYCSFGIPRAFISLLRNYRGINTTTTQAKFNQTIADQVEFIESEYKSIAQKMPQYKGVIDAGFYFFKKVIDDLKEENKGLQNVKIIHIGVDEKSIKDIRLSERMLRFLIEAGLLFEDTSVKHGSQGEGNLREYRRFIPHLLFLVDNRTFSRSRGFNTVEILNNIRSENKKHPLRRTISSILNIENIEKLKLNLPSCRTCGTPRLTEEQRFCHICGSELIRQSAFENCMQISIDELPITEKMKGKIKSELKITQIGQIIILQDPGTELQKIHYVGPKKSEKIYRLTLELVEEFLA